MSKMFFNYMDVGFGPVFEKIHWSFKLIKSGWAKRLGINIEGNM